jgi:hypothetical protein
MGTSSFFAIRSSYSAFEQLLNYSGGVVTLVVNSAEEHFKKLFDYILSMKVENGSKPSPFATHSMRWIHELSTLVRTFGCAPDNFMTRESWIYGISEAFKHSHIEIVPGVYKNSPCSVQLQRLVRSSSQSRASAFVGSNRVSSLLLGFQLPITEMPDIISSIFRNYLTGTISKNIKNERNFQLKRELVESIRRAIDLDQPYDRLLIITAYCLSLRKPLPCVKIGAFRTKEWSDLNIPGSSSVDTGRQYCLLFIIRGMCQRYCNLREGDNAMIYGLFKDQLGMIFSVLL